jgi:thioredoxin-like negative regulator of GroEL
MRMKKEATKEDYKKAFTALKTLDEISNEMADKVVVVRINADDSRALCKELKIEAIPVLQIYKNKKLVWANTGFIEKNEVLKQLK